MTKNIYPCTPYPESCLETNNNSSQLCETGYTGVLCQTCDHGFAKYGGQQCGPCYSKDYNYLIIAGIGIGCMILLAIYIKFFSLRFI